MRPTAVAIVLFLVATVARAADTGPVAAPPPAPTPTGGGTSKVSAEMRYNEGEAFAREKLWSFAESAFEEATRLKPSFSEAWNGLGHARKMQRKFPAALAAYQEALRQRPGFPQALEYLGETYVEMGRMKDARATLATLQPLDAGLADRLAQAIDGGKTAGGW